MIRVNYDSFVRSCHKTTTSSKEGEVLLEGSNLIRTSPKTIFIGRHFCYLRV